MGLDGQGDSSELVGDVIHNGFCSKVVVLWKDLVLSLGKSLIGVSASLAMYDHGGMEIESTQTPPLSVST